MVDLKAHVLNYFNGDRLWRYVYAGECGGDSNSMVFLHNITGLSAYHLMGGMTLRGITPEMVVSHLIADGPAMISHFDVFSAFTSELATHSWMGRREDVSTGQHAMALVGHRTTADGQTLFLVQNWWAGQQFFECDLAFLYSRHAHLTWITAPPESFTKFPDHLGVTREAYEENELTGDDCEENDGPGSLPELA